MRSLLLALPGLFAGLLGLLPGAAAARADVLELTDGRIVEGVVIEAGESFLVFSRFGPTEVPVADVRARSAERDVDAQVQEHLARLGPDDTEGRALLAGWLVRIGREAEGHAMAEAVLETDPENATAHQVLGHVRHQGVWRTPDEARRAEGLEKHGDRWYTPQEWANVRGAARERALEAERQARVAEINADVNRAVALMLSPDPSLRARGRARLEALAQELQNPSFAELARHVDAYVAQLDEVRKQAAVAAASGTAGPGFVTGEFRVTLSKLKRPIETFETGLGSNLSSGKVKIQLPELEVIRVNTVGIIPTVVR